MSGKHSLYDDCKSDHHSNITVYTRRKELQDTKHSYKHVCIVKVWEVYLWWSSSSCIEFLDLLHSCSPVVIPPFFSPPLLLPPLADHCQLSMIWGHILLCEIFCVMVNISMQVVLPQWELLVMEVELCYIYMHYSISWGWERYCNVVTCMHCNMVQIIQ